MPSQTTELAAGKPHKSDLNVCVVAYTFYEADFRVIRYAEALSKRGNHVDVIALKKPGTDFHEVINGVNVYRIQKRIINEKGKLSYLFRLVAFFIKSLFFVTKFHLKNKYQLVHVHTVPDFEVFAAIIPKLFGAKIILDIHDILPELYASKFSQGKRGLLFKLLTYVEKISTGFADHVIIANDLWYNTLTTRSVNPKHCTALLNYPDQIFFKSKEREKKNDKLVILYPGTLNWHQGLDIAISAFAKIHQDHPQAEFHIYGEGPEKENLKQQVKDLSIENKVSIKDSVSHEKIVKIMGSATIGIVPKRNDSFGGEASALKLLNSWP